MNKIGLAIKTFFKVLRNNDFAEELTQLSEGRTPALPAAEEIAPEPEKPAEPEAPEEAETPEETAKAIRNDAVTLLAALQREGRFIDFMKESLDSYSDAQIGAVVRDVHKGCAKALDRIFAIQPVVEQAEGSKIEIDTEQSLEMISLIGNVSGEGPYSGTLQRAGWKVSQCELPQWSGTEESVNLIVPAEVEL